jgi:hypothetical protein
MHGKKTSERWALTNWRAQRGASQGTNNYRAREGHSLSDDPRWRDKSSHERKMSECEALTA